MSTPPSWGKVIRPEPRLEDHWLARLQAQGDQPDGPDRLKPQTFRRLRLRRVVEEKA